VIAFLFCKVAEDNYARFSLRMQCHNFFLENVICDHNGASHAVHLPLQSFETAVDPVLDVLHLQGLLKNEQLRFILALNILQNFDVQLFLLDGHCSLESLLAEFFEQLLIGYDEDDFLLLVIFGRFSLADNEDAGTGTSHFAVGEKLREFLLADYDNIGVGLLLFVDEAIDRHVGLDEDALLPHIIAKALIGGLQEGRVDHTDVDLCVGSHLAILTTHSSTLLYLFFNRRNQNINIFPILLHLNPACLVTSFLAPIYQGSFLGLINVDEPLLVFLR
jgi:hypothetical protein